MQFTPDVLTFANGNPVASGAEWQKRRKEILDIFSKYEYGYTPKKRGETKAEVVEVDEICAAGHGIRERINITVPTDKGDFTFPINYFHPNDDKPHLTFVYINFRPDYYDRYCPTEEIIDRGYAFVIYNYEDVTSDDENMTDKLLGMFEIKDELTGWGKIGAWAFSMSRIADYLETRKEVSCLAAAGHSRLGKTALWCGAQDERFKFVISNDSGCAGAAYERIKHENGETVKAITEKFWFWFCKNYLSFVDKPQEMPFDQHMLLSLIAPRYLCVGSASLDFWADPYSEQLSCIGASPVWQMLGKDGYIGKETAAEVGESFNGGDIHYHLRHGRHFFSRNDWNAYIDFIKEKGY